MLARVRRERRIDRQGSVLSLHAGTARQELDQAQACTRHARCRGHRSRTWSRPHKAGCALRFPRIVRVREDTPVAEIDTLQRVRELAGDEGPLFCSGGPGRGLTNLNFFFRSTSSIGRSSASVGSGASQSTIPRLCAPVSSISFVARLSCAIGVCPARAQ